MHIIISIQLMSKASIASYRESIEYQIKCFHYLSLIAKHNEFSFQARAVSMIRNLFSNDYFLSFIIAERPHTVRSNRKRY
jgi:hypothetical protein